MNDVDRAVSAMDRLEKEYREKREQEEAAEKNTSAMSDFKKALYDRFERPYRKYGL